MYGNEHNLFFPDPNFTTIIFNPDNLVFYSVRNDFTGFAIIVFNAWIVIIRIVMKKDIIPAAAKTHQLI